VPAGLEALAAEAGIPLWWIEDGFLRSVGLGAALVPPASLTLDRSCPHYDPRRPSDLEHLLQHEDFSADMLERATALIARIRASAVTKYNLPGEPVTLPAGRRIILVPGQVEDDRSVVLGGAGIVRMADLLARVRAEEPGALIVYKPHPDVVSKLRADSLPETEARGLADHVLPNADLVALLDRVDAVHTLTSLAGFEALIRGREVIVHGQPFYAGWGLTRDLAPVARRTRRRSLAELAAAALILYPLYADPVTGLPCTPEDLVSRLAAPGHGPGTMTAGLSASLRAFAARCAAWHAARRKRTGR
jgi:capsular polysaccharide export protein